MTRAKDMTGFRFGKLTVLGRAPNHVRVTDGAQTAKWNCRCDCGAEKSIFGYSLRNKTTQSCGCVSIEKSTIHAQAKNPLFPHWCSMMARCRNPKVLKYPFYGGRGIKVCERWNDVRNFIQDMGPKPRPDYTLDRINGDGDYEPSNCRWASRAAQQSNLRSNHRVKITSTELNLTQWERVIGVAKRSFHQRVRKHGGSFTDAVQHFYDRMIKRGGCIDLSKAYDTKFERSLRENSCNAALSE